MLPSLKKVYYLDNNQITDEGCAALASALRGGALPALRVGELFSSSVLTELRLDHNPASQEARAAVLTTRAILAFRCSHWSRGVVT